MTYTRNEGVVVTGGSFTSTNTAIGKGSQVKLQQASGSDTLKEVQRQLALLLEALEKHKEHIPNSKDVIETAQSVKEEIAREKPNRLTLKALLGGIADSVKSVSGVAIAVEGLKAAVTALLG